MRALWLGMTLAWLLAGAAAQAAPADVRVLIDVSGSMKQNDPQNLRRPALRLLVGLLQPETEAGVWTFAQSVNMLVPHGRVDAAWKERATALSEQIGSPGQFTDIEEVLERATSGWLGEPPATPRHLLLLTDGMVDVSKEPGANQASRRRILDSLLPRIRDAGARVHAVALSDRADHQLLRALAGATDGRYEQVASAEELQRVFLRIFEQAARPEGVPLEGNRFQLDRSIREATVLVFRAADAKPTRLHAPDGSSFAESDIPAGIAWQHDQGYDLITIADPQPGVWRLEADEDPDNRVLIVTDLKLETSELPSRLAVGESVDFSAYLSNHGRPIERRAFLDLVELRAVSDAAGDVGKTHPLNDRGEAGDAQPSDGRYAMRFGAELAAGPAALVVTAESSTFVREKRFLLEIARPAVLTVQPVDNSGLEARLVTDDAVLARVDEVVFWQGQAPAERAKLEGQRRPDGEWSAALHDPARPVLVRLRGETRAGNRLDIELGPAYPPGVAPTETAAHAPPEETAVEPAIDAESTASSVTADVGAEPEADDGLLAAALVGGANLLLLVGALIFWLLRRRGAVPEPIRLVDDPSTEPEPSPAPQPVQDEAA